MVESNFLTVHVCVEIPRPKKTGLETGMTNSLQPKKLKNVVDFSKVLNLFDLKIIEKTRP